MNADQIAGIVTMIATAFGRPVSAEMLDVYAVALEDLELDDPRTVVRGLLRTERRWMTPADIRAALLASADRLAPDEDQAWTMARRYAQHASELPSGSFDALPLPVQEALQTIGGSYAIKVAPETIIRAQFRDAYRLAKGRHDRELLGRSWDGLPLGQGDRYELPR